MDSTKVVGNSASEMGQLKEMEKQVKSDNNTGRSVESKDPIRVSGALPAKMAVHGKMEGEVEIQTDATTFHDVFSCRPHHISNMAPSKIQGVDLHEGEWGSKGTVITWNYVHEGVPKIAKERIEDIDDVNLSTTYRVIEGDILKDFKDFIITVKATPKPNGRTLVHWHFEYEKLHEGIPDPHTLLEFVIHCSKDIDDHHVAQAN